MSAVAVPGHVPAFQELESTPARALTLATDLRAVTVGVKDVQGWAAGVAAPGWEGDAGESHGHAATAFARRLDSTEAALDQVVRAGDLFEERLSRLHVERGLLDDERKTVNRDITALVGEAQATSDESAVPALRRRAEALAARAAEVVASIRTWVARYQDAETDFVSALRGADSLAEGRQAAEDPARIDVRALGKAFGLRQDDPVALAAWWARLSRAQRQALTTEHPHAVGNAAGLPVRDRDEANRAALESDLDHLAEREKDGQLSRDEKAVLDNVRHVRDALRDYRHDVDLTTGRELGHLIVLEPAIHSGDGGVAIGFGDPDTADHVSVNVPGLTSQTQSTAGNLDNTRALHDAVLRDRNGTVASVYWLDYDAPSGNPLNPLDPLGQLDFGGVAVTAAADEGGERLVGFVDGLRASDQGAPAHVTGIGHSYGSTTLGHALEDGLAVDDAVLIGSPGQPEPTAAELTEADVWVGAKDHDPVSLLGTGERRAIGALGHDPADVDFGGTRFETGDGSLRVQDLIGNHTSYFSGESLDNMAHIVSDAGGVTERPHRGEDGGGYLTLDELVTASTAASAGELVWDHGGGWLHERGKDGAGLIGDLGELLWETRWSGTL